MKKNLWLSVLFILMMIFFAACASTGGGNEELSIYAAIEQAAENIAAQLPAGSRVAIAAFESENDNLSDFIMEEFTGALIDKGIEVADRQHLDFVYRELGLQKGGDVSDENAQSIGKFLGAQWVVAGQLLNVGNSYNFRSNAIPVEDSAGAIETQLTIQDSDELRRITTAVKTSKYAVTERTVPKTAGTFLDRGIFFAVRGDYEKAIDDFTEALEIDPELSAAYLLRGRAIYANASDVTRIGDNFSSFVTTVSNSAATEEQAQAFDQAIADYNQALQFDPDNAAIYSERGSAYRAKGDNDRAIADYDQAIRLNSSYSNAYMNRGIVYRSKGDSDRAIADYGQAIQLNPNYSLAYYNRGNVYSDKGDNDRAIADYDQAIQLNPNYAHAYTNRGYTYRAKGDNDRAIANYDLALQLNPNNANAYNNRGYAYYMKEDYARAIADYEAALRIDSDHEIARRNLENARQQQ